MTLDGLVVVCGATAAWVAASRGGSPRAAAHRAAALAERPARAGPHRRTLQPSVARFAGAAGAAVAVAVLLGGGLRWPVALAVGFGTWASLGRLEPAAVRRTREEVARDLPFAADLLATCLGAGAPLPTSLAVVGDAAGGALGEAFAAAAASCELGAAAPEAMAPWTEDPRLVALEPLARTVVRAATSGTSLALPCARLADELRAQRRWRVDAVARRAGVRATAPLGVCFLPAFVLLGIVPVVLAGARTLAF